MPNLAEIEPSHPHTDFFENVFLINRFLRTDRLLETTAALYREGIKKVQLWEAVDNDSEFIVRTHDRIAESGNSPRGLGELACFASHLQLLRKLVVENMPSMLILDDDVNMNKEAFKEANRIIFNLTERWDMLFLGHCFEDRSEEIVSGTVESYTLQRSSRRRCTHAYLVSLEGARKLLEILPSIFEMNLPLDEFHGMFVAEGVISWPFHFITH